MGAFAANAMGADSALTLNGGTYTTAGASADAIRASNGASIVIGTDPRNGAQLNIVTTGQAARGLYSEGGATIYGENLRIETSGERGPVLAAMGAIASSAQLTLVNSEIETRGTDASGFYGEFGSSIALANSKILTYGANATGAAVFESSQGDLSNVVIETRGEGARAVVSRSTDSQMQLSNITAMTSGKLAHGLHVVDNATAAMIESRIRTTGERAFGVWASAASADIRNSNIETEGVGSSVIVTNAGGSAVISSSIGSASGTEAAGVYASGGDATKANSVRIIQSEISSANGPSILAAAGTHLNVDIQDGSNLRNGNGILLDATQTGAVGSVVNLTADNGVHLSGDIRAANNNVANVLLSNNSSLIGAASHGGEFTVDGSSVWTITGDSEVNALNLAGKVAFAPPDSGSFKTLKVTGAYVGQDGTLGMSTVLGDDDSATDKLLLSGIDAVASGHTSIQITNAGGLGAQTTGDSIVIVATENGASLDPGSFTLAGEHVDAGAYEYRLYQTSHGAALKSTVPPVDPGPNPDPGKVAYRSEVALISALPAQLRQADLAMLGDLHKRMGDENAQQATSGMKQSANRRVWGRVLRTDPSIYQQGTVSPESRGHLTGFQAGLDLYADKNVKAGLYVGQLDGDMSTKGFASGVENKYVGFNNLRSRYLGVYGTWQDESGMYADAVLQAANYRSTLHTVGNQATATTKGNGWLASLELGKPYALNSNWQVEPQAQLIYRKLNLDDTALSLARVQNKADDDWTLRLGARIKGTFTTQVGLLQPYGRINVYKCSSTTDVARFIAPAATTDIHAKGGYLSTELAAGASLQLNHNTSIYGELGKLWSNGGDNRLKSGIQASMGVKVVW